MKYIKTYENTKNEHLIELGEYILANDEDANCNEFISKNVGKLVKYYNDNRTTCTYLIEYKNVPGELAKTYFLTKNGDSYSDINHILYNEYNTDAYNCRLMNDYEIIYHSKNKEDVEIRIEENKYNL